MFARKPPIRFAEPGSDPTGESSTLSVDGPKMSGCLIIVGIGLAVLLIGGQIAYSNRSAEAAQNEALPTVAQLPSITPSLPPSWTPQPVSTWTPLPTYTLYPTYTPAAPNPTAAPTRAALIQISPTPIPTLALTEPAPVQVDAPVLATWTPGAWLLTRAHATLHPATATPTYTMTPEAAP